MARSLRIEYPGAYYHVTSRGNERRAIFRNKGDRKNFVRLINRDTSHILTDRERFIRIFQIKGQKQL